MRAWPPAVKRLPPAPTAFLDRDGVLNRDRAGVYITNPAELKLYAAAAPAVRLLAAKGYRVVVVSNQSGVARGYMTLARARQINLQLVRLLRAQGARLAAVYFCPHGPDAGCACRKPEPGLIKEANRQSPADMALSFVAGDKPSDLELGRRAGLRSFLVRTGQGRAAGARRGFKDLLALARAVPDLKRKTK
ncbi:MAG: HAD family hydrolase [Elusimicrobiales bacterium]|nr:HAD family hydrolase [Elusimicrobiales bacterium]